MINIMNKKTINQFIYIGIIFIITGFIQQDFKFNFSSGLFNMGIIFTISGLATLVAQKSKMRDKT